jgi:hypothetical protein
MQIKIIFTEPLLGTLAGNKEVASEFILANNPKGMEADEVAALPPAEALEKSSTVFPKENGVPFIWDYQFKGFLKEACEAMLGTEVLTQEELKKFRLTRYLYKKTIDQLVFVSPRKIMLKLPEGGKIDICERPLRGQTMQGERIALARSEQVPAGTEIELTITSMNEKLFPFIEKWLTYGELKGTGQWRNSGKGRFIWCKV